MRRGFGDSLIALILSLDNDDMINAWISADYGVEEVEEARQKEGG